MWVLDHLPDIEADFRVFYGLDPEGILNLSGPQFFSLAYRVGAYDGAVTARMHMQEAPRGSATRGADKTVEGSRTALESDSALAGLIDW